VRNRDAALHEQVARTGPEHEFEQNGGRGTGVLHMTPPEARE
jgi:hypothetical protein